MAPKAPNLSDRASASLERLEPFYQVLAVAVSLALWVSFTYTSWNFARLDAENKARVRFEFRVSQVAHAIRVRLDDYEQALRGGVGLFAASAAVERSEWRAYTEHLRLEKIYPGIQGVGFLKRVPAADKARHESGVREEGFTRYAIIPPGERAEYYPIVYLEPFSGRNQRAFGFDPYSEPVRRAAMEQARDSGEPAVTAPLQLFQDIGEAPLAGFLMFLPVYRNDLDISSLERRRAALVGYVYSPFRANDLMRGIFGNLGDLRLRIFDDGPGDDDRLLYDNEPDASKAVPAPAFSVTTLLPMNGRTWRMQMNSLPKFEETIDRDTPLLVGGISASISALLLLIFWFLATMRARAVQLARSMTRELRESRERLALAVEGSNQALFDWDLVTGKVVLTGQWSRIVGGDGMDAAVATTIAELLALVHPDDLPHVKQQSAGLVRGEILFYQVDHRVRTSSGGWRWIASRAKVVDRDPLGRAVRVAGTNVDITESKEIERMKNEFIATVSHELRTPLTAIVGALGLLKELAAGKLPADAATFLGMAQQNSERLTALINDILDIEKIESGRMEFRAEPVTIPALLEKAVTLNAPYADRLGVRFELAQPIPAVTVTSDPDRLLQVITNLMSNAAKFSPAGSAVTVSADMREDAVRVAVTDRGPGIPEEFRDRIFGKFAQADSSDTRRKGGTGLGLAISKAIVERMGGTIGFDSVAGRGSTFYFDLPLKS